MRVHSDASLTDQCFGTLYPSHSLLFLGPCVEQHRLSSQSGLHASLRNDVRGPIVCSPRVQCLQLLVALSHTVHTPQLVAQAFTLLSQDVNLFDCCVTDRTGKAAVHGEVEPGQRGVRLKVLFAHSPLVQTKENTWNKQMWLLCGKLMLIAL